MKEGLPMHDKTQDRLRGKGTIALHRFNEKQHFDHYLDMVKHADVRRFLEPIHDSVMEEFGFLRRSAEDPRTMVYTIVRERDNAQVGAVMLTDIDARHRRAEVTRLIIAPGERRKGHAQEALQSLARFSFFSLRLRFLYCSVFATNEHGWHVFAKCGFEEYGRRNGWSFDGVGYTDEVGMWLTTKRFNELYRSDT